MFVVLLPSHRTNSFFSNEIKIAKLLVNSLPNASTASLLHRRQAKIPQTAMPPQRYLRDSSAQNLSSTSSQSTSMASIFTFNF